ncbi:MAG: hypothetical protein HWN80_18520 [Candidatus Lokiarchaeota archaeon]|nr:hypothetical protein [Candidatus Lokiarchaeota archaeon]
MKKIIIRIVTLIFITQVLLSSVCLIRNSNGIPIEEEVGFGTAPVIDGVIDVTTNEWNSAEQVNISLFRDPENETAGLNIDLWVLQAEPSPDIYSLNFMIRFDLEDHSSSEHDSEFIGILIADWDESLNFTDAKIVQFSNISENTLDYLDYYINDTVYYEDTISDGEGTANLDGNEIIYEFSIPVEKFEVGIEDVDLEHDLTFDFKIVYGKEAAYPDGIIISNIMSIHLEFPPGAPYIPFGELIMLISTIIVFTTIGALYVFYIYRITQLKKEIERIRS